MHLYSLLSYYPKSTYFLYFFSVKNILKTLDNSSCDIFGCKGDGSFLCSVIFKILKILWDYVHVLLLSSEKCSTLNILKIALTLFLSLL